MNFNDLNKEDIHKNFNREVFRVNSFDKKNKESRCIVIPFSCKTLKELKGFLEEEGVNYFSFSIINIPRKIYVELLEKTKLNDLVEEL